jgi:hypothetical protein
MIYAEHTEPRAGNHYTIEVGFAGLISALVQKVNIPDVEVLTKSHQPPGANFPTGYAAGLRYGDITLEKIMPADKPDLFGFLWLTATMPPIGDIHSLPQIYKMDLTIIHLTGRGHPIDMWYVRGAFPKEVKHSPQGIAGGEGDSPIIQKIVLKCDSYIQV